MVNSLPSWVQQPQQLGGASQPMAGANAPMAAAPPTPAQQVHNPNAWDGIGPNTNQDQGTPSVSNIGSPVSGASVGNLNLPQNMQQILSMFMNNGGQGFQGFQPVQGNPFANNGSNLSSWGNASGPGGIYGNGVYGGT